MKAKWWWVLCLGLILGGFASQAEGGFSQPDEMGNSTLQKGYFSLGAGYGISYGIAGLNVDVTPILPPGAEKIAKYFSLNVGLGLDRGGIGRAFGIRIYPLGRRRMIQPRLSFYYATVGNVHYKEWWYNNEDRYEEVKGLPAGAGLLVRLNDRIAVEGDLYYILYLYDYDFSQISGRVKFSVGVRIYL